MHQFIINSIALQQQQQQIGSDRLGGETAGTAAAIATLIVCIDRMFTVCVCVCVLPVFFPVIDEQSGENGGGDSVGGGSATTTTCGKGPLGTSLQLLLFFL